MKTPRSKSILGLFFLALGLAIIAAWYLRSFTNPVLFVGVGLAVFGAGMFNPDAMKEGAKEFKENAGDIIPLGRRSSDGLAVKVEPKDDGVI
jgi:hypothetical protein